MAKLLTLDEQEHFLQLTGHPGYPALLKSLEHTATDLERAILKMDSGSTSDRQMLVAKARAEGARQVLITLKTLAQLLKTKQES